MHSYCKSFLLKLCFSRKNWARALVECSLKFSGSRMSSRWKAGRRNIQLFQLRVQHLAIWERLLLLLSSDVVVLLRENFLDAVRQLRGSYHPMYRYNCNWSCVVILLTLFLPVQYIYARSIDCWLLCRRAFAFLPEAIGKHYKHQC